MITKQFQLFIFTRLLVSFLILFVYEIYSKNGLTFPDLEAYSGNLNGYPPFYTVVNPFFHALTRWLNYTTDSFLTPHFIFLSLIINISFSSIYIYLSSKIHSYRSSLLFSAIIGGHPYLALHSLKIDTSVFLILPIGLIATGVFLGKWRNLRLISISISSLFRNAALPVGWILAFKEIRNFKSKIQILALVLLSYTSYLNFNYAFKYIGGEYGCYSFSKIVLWFNNLGLNIKTSEIISFFITPLIHLLLDLGSREAIALYCFQVPSNVAGVAWIHSFSTISFTIFHGFLLLKLVKFVYKNYKIDNKFIELILPLSILLPTFYGAAHMRYLIPLIPMLILFLFKFKLNNIH